MFGPYRLEERIGKGACGEVFRAFDTGLKRTVAVKRLLPGAVTDTESQARLQRESELAGRLASPHVIPVHGQGVIDGRFYIDMRLAPGPNLDTVLRREGALPVERAVRIVSQVASALQSAHDARLIHRDVKPSNILVTDADGEDFCYLADFGIARGLDGSAALSLTGTNALIGTFAYMAPELFQSGRGDHRTDVYALGCVLFECLTGRRPFDVEGFAAHVHHHMNVAVPPPSRFAAVPAQLDGVVLRAMAKRPEERFQSAAELARAARRAVAPTVPPDTPVPDPGRPGGSRPAETENAEVPQAHRLPSNPAPSLPPRPVPDGARTPPTGPPGPQRVPSGPVAVPGPGTNRSPSGSAAPVLEPLAITPRRSRRIVAVLVLGATVVVLGLGVLLARTVILQQYYIGVADDRVAIYQGVRGTALGIPLQDLAETSDIALTDLPQTVRSQVSDGIVVGDGGLDGAHSTVDRLRDRRLPPCSTLTPSATLAPGSPGTPGSTSTPVPTVRPQPGTNCRNAG